MQHLKALKDVLFQVPNGQLVGEPRVSLSLQSSRMRARLQMDLNSHKRARLSSSGVFGPLGSNASGSGVELCLELPSSICDRLAGATRQAGDPVARILADAEVRHLASWDLVWLRPGRTAAPLAPQNPGLLNTHGRLPAVPRIVKQLFSLLGDGNASVGDLAALVAKDPALAADVLRLANSPWLGLPRAVGSIQDACMLLGMRAIRDLVLLVGVAAVSGATAEKQENAVRVATATRALMGDDPDADDGYTAGLFHDVGRLLLLQRSAGAWARVSLLEASGLAPACAQRQVFGTAAGDLSAAICEEWGLPLTIVGAVRSYRTPELANAASARICNALHIAWALNEEPDPEKAPLDWVHLRHNQLEGQVTSWRGLPDS